MATWVTHLMIADKVHELYPYLDVNCFCVGNIAPDCNIENNDWTLFTPSREVTHWMTAKRKTVAGSDAFAAEYILKRGNLISSRNEYSFLLGYYAHLITDGAFQEFIRNDERVRRVWSRIKSDSALREISSGMAEDWDSVKKLLPKEERMNEIYTIEAEYLAQNPKSAYFTEILPLKDFPDYIDYLPHGCIARKIGIMGYMPKADFNTSFIAISKEEYSAFVTETVDLIGRKYNDFGLIAQLKNYIKK